MNLKLLFACPNCYMELEKYKDYFKCLECCKVKETYFPIVDGIPVFMTGAKTDKNQKFWDEGWKNRRNNTDFTFIKIPDNEFKAIIKKNIQLTAKDEKPLNFLKARKEDIILNIGCGLSEASGFAELGYNNYIGLDFSFTAARGSQKNVRRYNNNAITAQANAEQLPIKSRSIDVIYSSGVLHHTPNITKTLQEISRVMKNDGHAVIGLYNFESPKFIMARLKGFLHNIKNSNMHKWYEQTETSWQTNNNFNPWTKAFTKKEIKEIFSEAGFKNILIHKTNFQWGDSLPILGKYISKIKFPKIFNSFLRSRFGSMWVVIAKKN